MKRETTRPLGPGTTNVVFNAPDALVAAIDRSAKHSKMNRSEWLRAVCMDAVTSGAVFASTTVRVEPFGKPPATPRITPRKPSGGSAA